MMVAATVCYVFGNHFIDKPALIVADYITQNHIWFRKNSDLTMRFVVRFYPGLKMKCATFVVNSKK